MHRLLGSFFGSQKGQRLLCLHNLGGGPWGLLVQTDCLDYAFWNHESWAFSDAQKLNCYFIFVEIKWCLSNLPKSLTIFCCCFLQGEKKGNYCRNDYAFEKNIITIWLHKIFCSQIHFIFVIFIVFQFFHKTRFKNFDQIFAKWSIQLL